MKATGIVRRIDELGRLVLPIEMRRVLDIAEKDMVEIYVEGEEIILRKFRPFCVFCGSHENTVSFQDKQVCPDCIGKLRKLV